MSLLNLSGLTMIRNTLNSFSSPDSTAIYSIAEGLKVTLTGNTIKCAAIVDDSAVKNLLNNVTSPKSSVTHAFYFKGTS